MIREFIAVDNSTIWDVVNNTYGTVNQVVKLMKDNGFPNVNTYPNNGQVFVFDDTLIANQNSVQSNSANKKFATRNRTTTNQSAMKYYESPTQIDYKSNADGTTIISIPALIGKRVVSLEKEIRPIEKVDWGFNSSSGDISLLNGVTLDNDQTLFILYTEIKTS